VLFNKSRTLFGLHQGLRSIRKSAFAILVEGYFDAIALHQEGFAQAVAPLGTSLAEDHARLLNRYCSKVVICMDADTAGKRAAVRSAAILLEHGFAVNVIPLPEGEDPDSYIQTNSAEAFRTLIKDSQPAYHYILKLTAEKHDLTRPSGKRKALEELTPLLGRISDPIERSHAVGETSDILDVEQHIVAMELDKQKNRMSTSRERETRHLELISKAEKELLAAAFIDREEAQKAIEDFVVIDYLSPFARVFLEGLLTQSEAGKTPSAPQIADLFSSADEKRLVAELALSGEESRPSAPWESAAAIVINGLTREFEKMGRKMSELQRQQPSSKELESLFAERLSTKQRINELEKAIQSRNFSVKDKKVV
jgi:DNA primase